MSLFAFPMSLFKFLTFLTLIFQRRPESPSRRLLTENPNPKNDDYKQYFQAALNRTPKLLDEELVAVDSAPHQFLRFSAYRFNETTLFVVGLASARKMTETGGLADVCFWLPEPVGSGKTSSDNVDSLVKGNATNFFVGESHDRDYETVVIECDFPGEKPRMRTGGRLFLGLKGTNSTSEISPTIFLVLKEPVSEPSPKPKLVEVAHCNSPLHNNMEPTRMEEFHKYYNALYGYSAVFFMYDAGGVSDDIRKVTDPMVSSGALTIIDLKEWKKYDTWFENQLLALADCLHRARFLARWVANFDYDEYLVVQPPQTLKSLIDPLQSYDSISFGAYLYNVQHCIDGVPTPAWAAEKAIYRRKDPVCNTEKIRFLDNKDLCERVYGRRKWLANTKSTILPSVHIVRDVTLHRGKLEIFVTSTNQARFAHFRHWMSGGKENCRYFHTNEEEKIEDNENREYIRDSTVSDFARSARMYRDTF